MEASQPTQQLCPFGHRKSVTHSSSQTTHRAISRDHVRSAIIMRTMCSLHTFCIFNAADRRDIILCMRQHVDGHSDLKATNVAFASPKTGMGIACMVAFFARSSQRDPQRNTTAHPRVHVRSDSIVFRNVFSASGTVLRIRFLMTFFSVASRRSGQVNKQTH